MQHIINKLREALSRAADPATSAPLYDQREIRSIIDLLLEEVCGWSRLDRVLHADLHPTPAQEETLSRYALRLAEGYPVQQVLGYEWFCGLKFRVTPDVLIPRPETAELVDWIVQTLTASPYPASLRILDCGTGSGCIAIALAHQLSTAQVLGIDLSTAAIHIARENACSQHVDNVQFAQCDLLRMVDNSYFQSVSSQFSTAYQPFPPLDVIVSNPPYICRQEAAEMSSVVLYHEPEMALFVPDDDPLLFYRSIARFARQHLAPAGHLFFEINAAYGQEVVAMLRAEGFCDVELRQDINGRDRMVHAFNP